MWALQISILWGHKVELPGSTAAILHSDPQKFQKAMFQGSYDDPRNDWTWKSLPPVCVPVCFTFSYPVGLLSAWGMGHREGWLGPRLNEFYKPTKKGRESCLFLSYCQDLPHLFLPLSCPSQEEWSGLTRLPWALGWVTPLGPGKEVKGSPPFFGPNYKHEGTKEFQK